MLAVVHFYPSAPPMPDVVTFIWAFSVLFMQPCSRCPDASALCTCLIHTSAESLIRILYKGHSYSHSTTGIIEQTVHACSSTLHTTLLDSAARDISIVQHALERDDTLKLVDAAQLGSTRLNWQSLAEPRRSMVVSVRPLQGGQLSARFKHSLVFI